MKKIGRCRKAFTLIELLVTIAVMGILATIVTVAGVSIARSVRNNRYKTLVMTYYNDASVAMEQLNLGTTIYGNNPQNSESVLKEIIKQVAGTEPKQCYVLDNKQSYKVVRPNHTDEEGYYVGVRKADPSLAEYPTNDTFDELQSEWFVEVVYLLRDSVVYRVWRSEVGVDVDDTEVES